MERRALGASNLMVSELGLGCVNMSDPISSRPSDTASIATIHRAIELGINFFDTADVYGMGHNEELLAKALRSKREEVIVATKFGYEREPDGTYQKISGKPELVRSSCHASLRRLKTEVIDLYYQHRVDPNIPIEETVGAMAQLVQEGKVRFLGLCEASAKTIRRASTIHPITAVQSEYSLWTRDVEAEILPTCKELTISFVAFSPLGRGFFTGSITNAERDLAEDDFRRGLPRFQPENFNRNLPILQELENLAQSEGCKPAQLALAWLLAQDYSIVPIPGTKNQMHLKENIESLNIKLSQSDVDRIAKIFHTDKVHGMRYPESSLRRVNL